MKKIGRPAILVLLVVLSIIGPACDKTQEKKAADYPRKWNDAARFLAGIPGEAGSTAAELEKLPEFQKHKQFFDGIWPRVESSQLVPMRKWAADELAFANQRDRFIFYPFSGADFLNIYTFFPRGNEYLFFGLEPPGHPPDVTMVPKGRLAHNLGNIQLSLKSILNQSYFQTLHMESDFRRADLKGAIPLILVFIARTGCQVMNVEQVMLGKDAKLYRIEPEDVEKYSEKKKKVDPKAKAALEEVEPASEKRDPNLVGGIPGIRVIFRRPGETMDRVVTYLSLDISDPAVEKKPFFFDYVRQREPSLTYIKAASYLLHWNNFTMIRNFVLDRSELLLQDDTGVPIRYLDKTVWDLSFFGNYTRPIPLFDGQFQPDLRQVYIKKEGVKPIAFGLGYRWQLGASTLIMAKKKQGGRAKSD